MPTYEYLCKGCGKKFEYFQSMTEDPLTTCEECGGELHRLVGAGAGIIFKGSGFYITDYGHGNGKMDEVASPTESESAHADAASAKESAESAKSEPAKPAAATPAASETKSDKSPAAHI